MELWDIYDINKKKTGRVIDRCSNEKLRKGEYHLVVEAIIINSKGEILVKDVENMNVDLLQFLKIFWIVNPFLDNFYKDTFLYSIGVK